MSPILVEMDSREPREFLHHLKSVFDKFDVKTRKPIFEVEIKALPVGDYVLGKTIGIERKTASDLLSSIPDKRIFRQIDDLVKTFGTENSYLLLEGSIEKRFQWSGTKISRESVYGALRWIGQHCHIINTNNLQESAKLLISMAKQTAKEETPHLPKMVISKPRENEESIRRWQMAILQTFPRIGVTISTNILRYYETPIKFFNALINGDRLPFKVANKEECLEKWIQILTVNDSTEKEENEGEEEDDE